MKRIFTIAAVLLSVAGLFFGLYAAGSGLSTSINSKYHELTPVFTPNGRTLFFCREGHPDNVGYSERKDDQDIWMSTLNSKGAWSRPVHIKADFNSKEYDFPLGVSPDGLTLYVNNIYEKGKVKDGISYSRFVNGKWTAPEPLKIRNFYNRAALSNYYMALDGKSLLINVERRDTVGGLDLYVSFPEKGGRWSEPLNLGPLVNSKYNEGTPFLAPDGKTLYFASNTPGGAGGYDMYVTRRLDDSWRKWSKPKNLGSSVNTKENDTSYVIHPSGAYGVYSRKVRGGNLDLYRTSIPKEHRPEKSILVSGKVVTGDGKPVDAEIYYFRLSDGMLLGRTWTDSKTGKFTLSLVYGERYGIRADKDGFLPESATLDLKSSSKSKYLSLTIRKIEKGANIRLNNVFFSSGSNTLTPDSFAELDRLAEILKSKSSLVMEVGGHTDNRGKSENNLTLSQQRAEAVVAYLIKKGVKKRQVVAKGYGHSEPLASNSSGSGRKQNRRVEFKVLKL
ncbi:MAG: OmpA family protein [Leptospirales bacterium]